jgi:hypothetical protein
VGVRFYKIDIITIFVPNQIANNGHRNRKPPVRTFSPGQCPIADAGKFSAPEKAMVNGFLLPEPEQ